MFLLGTVLVAEYW